MVAFGDVADRLNAERRIVRRFVFFDCPAEHLSQGLQEVFGRAGSCLQLVAHLPNVLVLEKRNWVGAVCAGDTIESAPHPGLCAEVQAGEGGTAVKQNAEMSE